MSENMEKRVGQYVAIRDLISEIKDRHKEELLAHEILLERLAGIIHRFMDAHNLENLRTAAGTCYISMKWTANVQDPAAFMKFVIDNEEFDLLERRASSTAVKAYVEENNHLPTGVNLNALSSIGVRRPANTKS